MWSDNRMEMRRGTYNEFYGSIFVRTFVGVLDRPKYSDIPERYMLEQWFSPALSYDPDIPATKENGDFLCLYVFQNNKGEANPIDVIPKIAEIYMNELMKARKSRALRKSEELQRYEDKLERDRKLDEDIIDTSDIQNALHMKDAIGYTKELKDK